MKRWPILVSFVLFLGLCASLTFWILQFLKPTPRLVAAPKQQTWSAANPEAAAALFGGRAAAAAAATNFQLKGVVVAGNDVDSVAILVPEGKPAVAVRVNGEAAPGVTVKEVHAKYVLLSEGGVVKRVELPMVAQTNAVSPVAVQSGIQQTAQQFSPPVPQPNLQPATSPPMPSPAPPPSPPLPQSAMPAPGGEAPPPNPASPRMGRPS